MNPFPEDLRPSNVTLSQDSITPKVWVSTAAICLGAHFGLYWQVETWIFSEDPRQRTRQVIHGTRSVQRFEWEWKDLFAHEYLEEIALRAHGHIVNNLRKRFSEDPI